MVDIPGLIAGLLCSALSSPLLFVLVVMVHQDVASWLGYRPDAKLFRRYVYAAGTTFIVVNAAALDLILKRTGSPWLLTAGLVAALIVLAVGSAKCSSASGSVQRSLAIEAELEQLKERVRKLEAELAAREEIRAETAHAR